MLFTEENVTGLQNTAYIPCKEVEQVKPRGTAPSKLEICDTYRRLLSPIIEHFRTHHSFVFFLTNSETKKVTDKIPT